MRGPEAAEFVYAGERFMRVGAMPVSVLLLLQQPPLELFGLSVGLIALGIAIEFFF